MARRRITGLPKTVRRARALTYSASRTLGNVQPFVDLFATGRVDLFAGNATRRYLRRAAGSWFSQYSFGKGGLLKALIGMLVGHSIGKIGRR